MTQGYLFGGADPSRDCSREARARVDTARLRELVEQAYMTEPRGMTADEVAGRLGLGVLSVRPRVAELKRDRRLYATGTRRRNDFNNSCAVMMSASFPYRGGV